MHALATAQEPRQSLDTGRGSSRPPTPSWLESVCSDMCLCINDNFCPASRQWLHIYSAASSKAQISTGVRVRGEVSRWDLPASHRDLGQRRQTRAVPWPTQLRWACSLHHSFPACSLLGPVQVPP